MFEETAVFTSDCSINEVRGHVIQAHLFAVLKVDLGNLRVTICWVIGVVGPEGVLLGLLTNLDELGKRVENTDGAVCANARHREGGSNHRGDHDPCESAKPRDTQKSFGKVAWCSA